jgi:hypothetical protein
VISGRYVYRLDGAVQPIEETFEAADGRITSRRVAAEGAIVLTVEREGATALIALDLPDASARAEYAGIEPGVVEVRRTVNGERRPDDRVAARGMLLFPLLRVFAGDVVRAVAAGGAGGRVVLVPDIRPGCAPEDLLAPVLDVRTAEPVGPPREDLSQAYGYVGGSYEDGAVFRVRPDGLLAAYAWRQPEVGTWEVDLVLDAEPGSG